MNEIIKFFLKLHYKNNILLFFSFIITVSITSLIFAYFLVSKFDYLFDENNNIILKNIPFYYGPVIENLINGKGHYHEVYGFKSYIDRFPFVPIFISILSNISTNIYFFLILKNIILFAIFYISLNIFCKDQELGFVYFYTILIILFSNFYNTTTVLNFIFSDSFIGIFLPSTFLILISENKNKFIYVSLILFFLFFMKTTMFLVAFVISLVFIILENKVNILKRFMPLIFLIFASILWGSYGYFKTGIFPIGSKISSSNQLSLATTLNKNFHKYYPEKSVDIIPKETVLGKFQSEWEMYEYYKKRNNEYIKENKNRILKDGIIKIKFILFNTHKDGVHPDIKGQFKNPFMFSHFFNRLVAILSLIISILLFLKNVIKLKLKKIDIYFILFYFSSIIPYVIGWATSKHLVGIFLVSHIYLLLKILNTKLFKDYINSIISKIKYQQ